MDAGDPVSGLQSALDGLENASVGYRTRAGIASPLVGGAAASAMTLYVSGTILTLSILGILVISRIVLALLLAIAPVMAGFILFDATRGMAAKWLSAMATVAFAPMFVLVLASVELAIVGPLIARLLSQQAGNRFDDNAVIPIGLVTVIFGLAMVAAVRAGSRIASGIRLPSRAASPRTPDVIVPPVEGLPALVGRMSSGAPSVSHSLERMARREANARPTMAGASSLLHAHSGPAGAKAQRDASSSPDILASRSRTAVLPHARRRSRSAARRDG
jgi:type IV secretion system protein VirB6